MGMMCSRTSQPWAFVLRAFYFSLLCDNLRRTFGNMFWCAIENWSTCGTFSPAPTRKSQWDRGLAGRTHAHGQVLPWGIRPALYVGCYETCFGWNSLTLDWGSKCLLSTFNFLKSVLNHPSMECNQFNHFHPGAVTSFSLKSLSAFSP